MSKVAIRPLEDIAPEIDVGLLRKGTHVNDLEVLKLKGYYGFVSIVESPEGEEGVLIYMPCTDPKEIGLKG